MYPKLQPSVVPKANFNSEADVHALRRAIKETFDDAVIIETITRRSNQQRQTIKKKYNTLLGENLIADIQSETSGYFDELLTALLTPSGDFYVNQLHRAIAGLGTDEVLLIEVLCSLSTGEIRLINEAYSQTYGKTLESDITGDTSGGFRELLVTLCRGGRDENVSVDIAAATRDAIDLLKAGELNMGTDKTTFKTILCKRSYEQLNAINDQYKMMTGHGLAKAIEDEFSGDLKDALLAVFQYAVNKSEYLATRLHKEMTDANNRHLIWIIVARSEIDLLDVKEAFQRKYDESLKSWIDKCTAGQFKQCLYSLIREDEVV